MRQRGKERKGERVKGRKQTARLDARAFFFAVNKKGRGLTRNALKQWLSASSRANMKKSMTDEKEK